MLLVVNGHHLQSRFSSLVALVIMNVFFLLSDDGRLKNNDNNNDSNEQSDSIRTDVNRSLEPRERSQTENVFTAAYERWLDS